jgi:hypothetical protein
MSDVLKRVLQEAISVRERELEELRRQLRDAEKGESSGAKPKRRRKATGLKEGSIPHMIVEILRTSGPLGSADISERLKVKGKEVHSRFVAAAMNRYVESGRIFNRSNEGLYSLRSDAA